MIYIDTSALVKLLFDEPESTALTDWLTQKTEIPKVSSELSTVELLRTCQRIDGSLVDGARRLLDGVDLLPVDHVIVERAAVLAPRELRSLDAIHLVSALSLIEDLTDFVVYDVHLYSAAKQVGLPVVSPT
ncbi:type II toxin-antitoxin system VapC family toxin [Ferrimicrobium sp.]|uniref:type II toxin-antitoxin system VapC family toxin n=1 Tax=Ferrimicrobium sp. TaxID=2926050 RepID=UPI00262AF331|nr:type II toxin-antitoxin system VapC family toxin [Ferrimicrobium sp.]